MRPNERGLTPPRSGRPSHGVSDPSVLCETTNSPRGLRLRPVRPQCYGVPVPSGAFPDERTRFAESWYPRESSWTVRARPGTPYSDSQVLPELVGATVASNRGHAVLSTINAEVVNGSDRAEREGVRLLKSTPQLENLNLECETRYARCPPPKAALCM